MLSKIAEQARTDARARRSRTSIKTGRIFVSVSLRPSPSTSPRRAQERPRRRRCCREVRRTHARERHRRALTHLTQCEGSRANANTAKETLRFHCARPSHQARPPIAVVLAGDHPRTRSRANHVERELQHAEQRQRPRDRATRVVLVLLRRPRRARDQSVAALTLVASQRQNHHQGRLAWQRRATLLALAKAVAVDPDLTSDASDLPARRASQRPRRVHRQSFLRPKLAFDRQSEEVRGASILHCPSERGEQGVPSKVPPCSPTSAAQREHAPPLDTPSFAMRAFPTSRLPKAKTKDGKPRGRLRRRVCFVG